MKVVREFMKDTDSINMYKNMRETLVYLTHHDYTDTEKIMTEKLANQVSGGVMAHLMISVLARLLFGKFGVEHTRCTGVVGTCYQSFTPTLFCVLILYWCVCMLNVDG